MDTNWQSRKLVVTALTLLILGGVPILYKHLGISDSITQIVIGAVAAAGGTYNAFNALSKKYTGPADDTNNAS